MNQKFVFSSQGLPEAPARTRDSPAASHPALHGLAHTGLPSGWGCAGLMALLAVAPGLEQRVFCT